MAVTKMVVGLGNPGRQYEKTRHNLGFMVLMDLARGYAVTWAKSRQGDALEAEVTEGGSRTLLVLPLTYMNCSGQAVAPIAHFYQVAPADILVVVDDIRLELADMRLRTGGSDGGHNGLRSVARELTTDAYPRLRLGVGAPPPGADQADYVLSVFNAREQQALPEVIAQAAECCRTWMRGEVERAMTLYNQRKEKKDNE